MRDWVKAKLKNYNKPVVIKWFLFRGHDNTRFRDLEGTLIEPEPYLKFIQNLKGSENKNHSHYLSCYAFIDFLKNTFVYKCPVNLKATIEENVLKTHSFDQTFYDTYVKFREWNNFYGISLGPAVCFYSEESVVMEVTPLVCARSPSTSNILITPGRFNIGNLIRPIDFSGEIINPNIPIEIQRNDPLFSIRFITENNRPIIFDRVFQDEKLLTAVDACIGFKFHGAQSTPLEKLYKILDPVLRSLGFKKFNNRKHY